MTLLIVVLVGIAVVMAVVFGARYGDSRIWRASLITYQLRLPSGLELEQVIAWLSAQAALTHAARGALLPEPPVVVELVATSAGLEHRVSVGQRMDGALLASLRSALPGARLERIEPSPQRSGRCTLAAELWLAGRRRQLAIERADMVSRGLLAAAQPLYGDEQVRWQWILTSAGTPDPVPTSVPKGSTGPLPWWLEGSAPADADELRSARVKQREPLLHVSGRLVVQAGTRARARNLFGQSWGATRLLNVPGARLVRSCLLSPLVAIRADRYSLPLLRWPLRLNSAELAGLLAFPIGESPLPGVPTGVTRQVAPPAELPSRGTVLGDSTYPGFDRPLAISRADRLLHVALLGPTGTGKSTLMINMALQDAARGDGLALLDPKADMAADLLAHLPAERHPDVIVVNPADTAQPVGFNPLASDGTEAGRELAVDHVLHVFREQWKQFWGPRTDAVLRAALLVLTSTKALDGSSFTVCELPTMLTNPAFRQGVTGQASVPPAVHEFWTWFESLSAAERTQVVGPVLNKLTALTQRTPLRLLLGQSDGLDLAAAIRTKKIVLMPLSRGLVGAETAALLSSLMMASLWQAGLSRVTIPQAKRHPYWLYVDEASEVVRLPLDMADIMSEARGLGIGLTLATQHTSQLPTPVRNALLATVRSQVIFQVEVADAQLLARSFEPTLSADDLRTLPAHEVALRLAIDGRTSRPMTGKTRPLPEATGSGADLRQQSRTQYGRTRREVEAGLQARLQLPARTQATIGKRPRQGGQS